MPDDKPVIRGSRRVYLPGAVAPVSPLTPPVVSASAGTPEAESAQPSSHAESLLNDARRIAGELLGEVARLDAAVTAERGSARETYRAELASNLAADTQRRDNRLAALDTELTEQAAASRLQLDESIATLAPGAASRGWSEDWSARGSTVAPSSFQRFGTVGEPTAAQDVAALAPFLNSASWLLRGDLNTTLGQIQGALARVVAQVPLQHLRIAVFDPRIEGRLGMFARLRAVNASAFAPPVSGREELGDALTSIMSLAATNAEAISASGVSDLGELWTTVGMAQGTYTVLVVLNYPVGLDRESHATLARLAETGAPRGVSLIVQEDPDRVPAEGVDPRELSRFLTPYSFSASKWTASHLSPAVVVRDDGPPPKTVIDAVVTSAIEAAASQLGPEIPLDDFIDQSALWSTSSIDSIDAVIGRAGVDTLTLSLRSENPPHPNMLVGGAVGQGKSTLLLDIIYSLASRYSPLELELILLDFKRGLEFKRFDADETGKNWLPHARVLSLESDRPFGLAVLDYVSAELARRSQLFKANGANSITEYRNATGAPMARMLLVIDEFQVLFDGADELTDDAVARLEELARQGRAFGVHLLLGTQSVSGISGLRVKGDTIFAQFPIRVSLKNTVAESQALFSRQNIAPSELTYRGEVVVNRNYGEDGGSSNVRGIAAFASSGYLRELQARLWAKDPSSPRPLVFVGGQYAEWPAGKYPAALTQRGALTVWLGMPLEISDQPTSVTLNRDVDQSIAIVGRGDEESIAVVSAILATSIARLPAGSRIVVLDGDSDVTALQQHLDAAKSHGIEVEVVPEARVATYLIENVRPLLGGAAGPITLVLGLSLQKVGAFGDEIPLDPTQEFGPVVSGASVLQQLATRGGTKNVFFVGSWSNARTLSEHLSYAHPGIGTYVLLGLGLDDLRSILGPGAKKVAGYPRIIVVDRSSDQGERTVIPFKPITADVTDGWSE